MFAFFINESFFGFWSNVKGDVFFDSTVKAMGWSHSSVSLVYYDGSGQRPPSLFVIDENKNLVIQSKTILDGEIQEESIIDEQVIPPEFFAVNGVRLIPC
jgi:hypothetical protein